MTITARPATVFDAMTFAGGRAFLRRVLVWQVRNGRAEVLELDGEALALVMQHQARRRRVEVAIGFRPAAARHMPRLIRLAQLTLERMRQDGVLAVVRVRVSDARARRLARLAGFRETALGRGTIWTGKRA